MNKEKDILFLCQYFYPEYISSATLPFDTAMALKKAGYTVDALCGYPHEYTADVALPKSETVEGVNIQRIKYIQVDRKNVLGRLVNYFSFTFMVALRLFSMGHYRSIVVYSNPPVLPWVASWVKRLFGTKLIFVAYDLYPEIAIRTNTLRNGNIICRLMNHINKCVYQRSDAVVALSDDMRDYIVHNRKISPKQVHVIHNWYKDQPAVLSNTEQNSFAELTDGRFVVSYFGNMGIAQDMHTILDAIKLLKDNPDICFLFAGHGNKMERIRQAVSEECIPNVYIYDFLHGKAFQDALQISDCALVSLSEGLTGLCVPSKTYSYMMQGLPLLAVMDQCDIVKDIESGAGMWVCNGQSAELADTICKMKDSPEMLVQMQQHCRSIFLNKYTTEACTGKYVELFRSLL